jgi:hypothetical protein
MKLLFPLVALALICGACMTTDPRDIPLSEFMKLDSATQEQVKLSLTDQQKDRLTLAARAYGNDSNALNRRTLNQLIDEGEALQRNKPMYNE